MHRCRSSDADAWGELVFHVLAHVAGTAHLPASAFDPVYVAFSARHAGPAGERPLADDARLLAGMLPTHEALAEAQLLAWLFEDDAQARRASERDLAALGAEDVAMPELLPRLVAAGPAVEVLRCAAELEREAVAALPVPALDLADVDAALRELAEVAPVLSRCDVTLVRSLRQRGRVLRGAKDARVTLWVGKPEPALTLEPAHVAWQAAHEATVVEVAERAPLPHAPLEEAALALLLARATKAGRGEAHARWLAHLGLTPQGLGAAPAPK